MRKFLLTMVALFIMCGFGSAQNINVIEKELQEILNRRSDEMVEVTIMMKSQIEAATLKAKVVRTDDKSLQKEIVVGELKDFAKNTQNDVMAVLKAEEASGNVSDINALWIVNAISCKATREVIYMLSEHPDVAVMSYDKEVQLITPEQMKEIEAASVNVRGNFPQVTSVNADDVWNLGYTGKNVIVAVLDSGTNTNHIDLKDHLWKGYIDTDDDDTPDTYVNGWNFTVNNGGNSNITDDNGHGTHCAGIVCGDGTSQNNTGIAPDALLMTVKTVGRAGGGSVAQMLSGVQFAVENGADILSMSLGFKNSQLSTAQKEEIRAAFDNVLEAGVIVCAAAGNDGSTIGAPYNVDYPAACPSPWRNPDQTLEGGLSSVICVGASDLAASSQGPSTWEGTSYNDYPYNEGASMGLIRPDICALGDYIYSSNYTQNSEYAIKSGTSQATPCVAGVIALMLDKNSTLTPAQISQIIEETAQSKPATKNNTVGAGVVDALAAVNSITESVGNPFVNVNAFNPKTIATGIQTINITLKNEGAGASDENTTVTLSLPNDPYVTILNPTQTLGKLGVNDTKTLFFDLNVDSQTPSGHTITFDVTTTSGTFNWEDACSVKVSLTPNLAFYSVSPGLVGTNATSDIKVTMVNNGNKAFTSPITLRLVTTSYDLKYVTLIDNETTIPALGVGEMGTGTFTIETKEPIHPYDFFLETYSESTIGENYVYEFESGLEGWTYLNGSYYYKAPWLHSSEAEAYTNVGESNSGNGHLMSISIVDGTEQQNHSIDNYLVSPIKINVGGNTKVSFYARANNHYYYKEHFGFAVSTRGNSSINDFTTIEEWVITDRATWKKYTVDLSEYVGQEIYVAIRHFFPDQEWVESGYGQELDALDIDDIIFENIIVNTEHNSTYDGNDPYYFNVTASSNPNLPMVGYITATPMSCAMSLSWDAVNGVSEYGVYRDGHRVATVTDPTYIDEHLSYKKEYCYAVTTISSYESGLSEEVCATPLVPTTISVPTNLVAVATSTSTIDLQWDKVNEADNYKVYQGSNLIADEITGTIYTVENLDAETNYCFIVTAVNIVGESEDSESACATTFKDRPAAPIVTATADNESEITLTWESVDGALSYNVYQDEEVIASEITNTTYTITNLDPETNYCFIVTAVNEIGESENSESACATTDEEPIGLIVKSYDLSKAIGDATLTVTLLNKCESAISIGAKVTLSSNDSYITIVDGIYDLSNDVNIGETTTAEFSITISNDVPVDHNIDFSIEVEYEKISNDDHYVNYSFDNNMEGWTTMTSDNHNWYHSSVQNEHGYDKTFEDTGGVDLGGAVFSESYCNVTKKGFNPDHWIVAPTQVVPTNNSRFEVYVSSMANSYGYADETFGVFISTKSNNNPNDFIEVDKWTLPKEKTSLKMTVRKAYLNQYAGKKIWVAIRHYGAGDNAALAVGDATFYNIAESSQTITITSSFSVTANPSVNIYTGTGTWDIASNWSKGLVPTATDNVIINGNVKIESGNIIINALSINEGMSLTIGEGSILSINDIFVNTNANAFIIKDGAQVFQNNNNVAATFVMNIYNPKSWDNNHTEGWQFISSPMTNANISDFEPQYETGYDLFKYDGSISGAEWINYKGHINEFEKTFQQGRGYIASYEAQTTAEFAGTLNKATSFNFNVAYDGVGSWANFHLLGNPFTFNMDWDNVALTNVYDGFATIDPEEGGYVVSYGEGIIPVGDGFFVEAIGADPIISYGTGSKSRGENDKADYINLIATGAQGSNNLIVKFSGAEEKGFSKLENINPNIADIYVKNNGRQYSILGYDQDVQEIEVFFEAKEMGSYSISFDINGEFENVVLVDRLTGVETNMLLEDEYTFVASSNDNPNRFVLLINDDSTSTSLSNFAYINNRDIVIYDINGNANIKIFDAMGRCVFNGSCTDAIHRVPAEGFSAGVYVIQKVDDNGVNVQKIIL